MVSIISASVPRRLSTPGRHPTCASARSAIALGRNAQVFVMLFRFDHIKPFNLPCMLRNVAVIEPQGLMAEPRVQFELVAIVG